MPDFIEVPIMRIELNHIKQTLLIAVEARAGELKAAIEKGIEIAYQRIPLIVAERVRASVVEAVADATAEALKEYYSPGGAGYEAVMGQVVVQLTRQKVKED